MIRNSFGGVPIDNGSNGENPEFKGKGAMWHMMAAHGGNPNFNAPPPTPPSSPPRQRPTGGGQAVLFTPKTRYERKHEEKKKLWKQKVEDPNRSPKSTRKAYEDKLASKEDAKRAASWKNGLSRAAELSADFLVHGQVSDDIQGVAETTVVGEAAREASKIFTSKIADGIESFRTPASQSPDVQAEIQAKASAKMQQLFPAPPPPPATGSPPKNNNNPQPPPPPPPGSDGDGSPTSPKKSNTWFEFFSSPLSSSRRVYKKVKKATEKTIKTVEKATEKTINNVGDTINDIKESSLNFWNRWFG
ncbi:MAG: hypothetical protein AAGI66_02680 [Cyanobacteria bacterium P01_H01_bin.74]